jgi:hexokinase
MKNWARSIGQRRAYLSGARIKAVCAFCGRPIYNRMQVCDTDKGSAIRYGHKSCVRKHAKPGEEWGAAW